jgi:hypothetical protein
MDTIDLVADDCFIQAIVFFGQTVEQPIRNLVKESYLFGFFQREYWSKAIYYNKIDTMIFVNKLPRKTNYTFPLEQIVYEDYGGLELPESSMIEDTLRVNFTTTDKFFKELGEGCSEAINLLNKGILFAGSLDFELKSKGRFIREYDTFKPYFDL